MNLRRISIESNININKLVDMDVYDEGCGKIKKVNVDISHVTNATSYKNSAVVLIIEQPINKTLLLKLSYNCEGWVTPGGRIEEGEGPLESAIRELMEETGIILDLNEVNNIKTENYHPTNTKLFIVYIDEELPVTISDEHTDYKYVPINELPLIDLAHYARDSFELIRDKILRT